MASGKTQVVLEEGAELIVVRGGIRVEFNANGGIDVHGNAPVTFHSPANDSVQAAKAELQVGDMMPEGHKHAGRIYGGVSKTEGKPFYVAPNDSGVFQWKEAMKFASTQGARVPSADELDQMHDAENTGAFKNTFNLTGSLPAGWYWSSTQVDNSDARVQRFTDGGRSWNYKGNLSSVRLVWS